LHYTLADHVSAVLGTVNVLWGPGRPVVLAGHAVGATVALGCAATAPELSAGVVAFSPALIEPGTTVEDVATDERSARIVAQRDMTQRLADAARARGGAAETVEARLIPALRTSENAVLGIDADALLRHVGPPVRFVAPSQDPMVPRAWLARVCGQRDGFELLEVPGERDLPFALPVEAVRAIAPGEPETIELAHDSRPHPNASDNPLARATSGVQGALLRAGLLNLVAAAVVVLLNPVPELLLTYGFAAWVVVASVSAIVGAVEMKRQTAGTRFTFVTTALPTLLMGVAGLALASFLFADPGAARRFFGAMIAVYAMVRGVADIWVARRVEGTAKPRWLLYAGGAIGIATALAILFGPNHGRGMVRLSLALYLGLTGLSLVSYVVSARRTSRRRVREILGK
jgi:uncharacterized membrane protein HdeD (DUF308 family)